MSLLEMIYKALPELVWPHRNGKLVTATMKNMEVTEVYVNGQLYRIIVEEVNE